MGIDRARLPARHELKYYINPAELEALRRRLERVMRLDGHCRGGRAYNVRSLYFDDAFDSAYYDKLDGVMTRDKYRLRIYNHSDEVIFLERKRKLGELIAKDSVHITRRLAEQILSGNPNRLELSKAPLLHDLFLEMRTNLLRPVVRVDYYREAFTFPVSHTRVTFDKRLSTGPFPAGLFDLSPGIMALDDEREILEVKYDQILPDVVRLLLAGVPAERSAISKYVLCRRFDLMK